MKERFEAHRARMAPEERERTWSAISGTKRRGVGMWRIPTVAVSALATVAVVVLMVRTDTMPDPDEVLTRSASPALEERAEMASDVGADGQGRAMRDEAGGDAVRLAAPPAEEKAAEPSLENDVVVMDAPTGKRSRAAKPENEDRGDAESEDVERRVVTSDTDRADAREVEPPVARRIVGRIVDSLTGLPLEQANVLVIDSTGVSTGVGAITNERGEYVIASVPADACSLRVMYVGYAREDLAIGLTEAEEVRKDFDLDATIVELDLSTVEVSGKRQSIIDLKEMQLKTAGSRDDAASGASDGSGDAVDLKSGVVRESEGRLYARGGRTVDPDDAMGGVAVVRPERSEEPVPTHEESWGNIKALDAPRVVEDADPGSTVPASGRRDDRNRTGQTVVDGEIAYPPSPPPPDAMTHAHPGVNPFVDTATDALATFALDVDHASYTLARAYLRRGTMPPPAAIRVEEFVNAMPHDYAPPSGGPVATTTLSVRDSEDAIGNGTFAIHLDASETPFGEGKTLLRVGLKGREITRVERKPAILTFVVDTSGSMSRENRIGLVRDALTELLYQLDSRDRVAIVAYGSTARTVLPMTTIRERRAIESAIRTLTPNGSTNAEAGLRMAYEIADEHYEADAINRVILCSDGVANVGETDPDGIMATIKRNTGRGITMTAIGVGMGNYNDALLERIANTGDGSYYYVDSAAEAEKVFVESSVGTLEIIARDAKVQVELDPKVVRRYRLLGYENRDVADQDFRNDTVDAGEIGAGHEVTALFELELTDDVKARDRVATVRVRFESPEMGEVIEDARTLRAGAIRRGFDRMAPDFRLDAAVAELAEILRRSPHADGSSLDAVLNVAEGVQEDRPDAAHVAEVIELARRARDLVTDEKPPTWRER